MSEKQKKMKAEDSRRYKTRGRMCVWCGMEIGTNRPKSLTIKALDPFSPFVSLASNIEHAKVEKEKAVTLRHNSLGI